MGFRRPKPGAEEDDYGVVPVRSKGMGEVVRGRKASKDADLVDAAVPISSKTLADRNEEEFNRLIATQADSEVPDATLVRRLSHSSLRSISPDRSAGAELDLSEELVS